MLDILSPTHISTHLSTSHTCHSPKWLEIEFKLNSAKLRDRDRVVTDAVFQSLFPHYLSSNKGYQSVITSTSSTFSNFEPHRAKFSKDIRGGRKVGIGRCVGRS